jgi:outer membrane lipoprotein-sorting protein
VNSAQATDIPLLNELQQSLAGTTNVQSDFIQEKHLAVLQQKVLIKGRMAVEQPDRFSWQVTEPVRYSLVVEGDKLRQWDEETGRVQQVSLAGNAVFAVVVAQLRAWFAGNLGSLAKDFHAEQVPGDLPMIAFEPRQDSFAAKAVKRITLRFREDRRYVECMTIEDLGGDLTLMTFTNTVLNSAIDPHVWQVRPRER